MPPRKCSECGVAFAGEQKTCRACQRAGARAKTLRNVGLSAGETPGSTEELGRQLFAASNAINKASQKMAEDLNNLIQVRITGGAGWSVSFDGDQSGKPARIDDELDADRAPDLIEPLLAWRGWDLVPTGHLTASGVAGVWDPGPNKAVCKHAGHTEDVPAVGCQCGFYGWHEPGDIAHGSVRGAIKCWGEIIVHDVGVRAEYAEVLCLFANGAPDVFLKRAAERYGVPLVKDQAEAEALAAPQGIRVPGDMRPEKPKPAVSDEVHHWLPPELREPNPYHQLRQWGHHHAVISGPRWTPPKGEAA